MHFEYKDNRSKVGKYVPAFVFLIFIFGLAVWFIFSPKLDYSSSEKRYLEKFPEASVENVLNGQFGEDFEKYFADHFPNRNLWVGINAYFNIGIGNNGANGVYNCKNDCLINKPVSTDNNLEKNITAIRDFGKNTNVPISVMLVPSTGYIEDDVLPAFHEKYNDDDYFEHAKTELAESGIGFVDLRESFKNEYKNGTQLYYRTDHHWTTSGAYTAYMEFCKNLSLTPKAKEDFNIESYSNFYGTTYSTSGFWLTKPDSIELWNNPENTDKNIGVKITEGEKSDKYGSMYFYDHLKEDDKYPVFIDGNHALTEITNSNVEKGTILLIKDSFSHCFAPFLSENYSRVILVDMRYYKMSVSELVKQEKPEQIAVLYGIDNLATDTDIVWLK